MACEVSVRNNIVWVRYSGQVDALDVLGHIKDEAYTSVLRTYRKVVYDYTDTTVNNMTADETGNFVLLTKIEASLTKGVHAAIIPSDPEGEKRAKRYVALLTEFDWTFLITDSREEAFAHLASL